MVTDVIDYIEGYTLCFVTRIEYNTKTDQFCIVNMFRYKQKTISTSKHKKMICDDPDTIERLTTWNREMARRRREKLKEVVP